MSLSRLLKLSTISFAIAFSPMTKAIIVDALYDAELPISDRSAENREETIKKAFGNVLTRVSGSTQVLAVDDIEQSMAEYDKYVSRYTYKKMPKEGLQLQVKFDENMINGLFEKAQQAYIQKNRPLTLLLLVKEEEGQLKLVGGEEDLELTARVEQIANSRGIPIVLPLMDLTDQHHFQPHDILTGDVEVLQSTVQRYSAEEVIVGKLEQRPEGWTVVWHFVGHETPPAETVAQLEVDNAFHDLFEQMVGYYHTQYSNQVSPLGNVVQLQITGIQSLQDYAKISAYLRQLAAIQQVDVIEVLPDQATFNIQTKLDQEALSSVLNREPLLKRFAKETPAEVEEVSQITEGKEPLTYKLNT